MYLTLVVYVQLSFFSQQVYYGDKALSLQNWLHDEQGTNFDGDNGSAFRLLGIFVPVLCFKTVELGINVYEFTLTTSNKCS